MSTYLNFRRLFWLAGIILTVYGCVSRTPYAKTNRLSREHAKNLARELTIPPAAEHWVGSYHFNLRRPNFVILHHTAQHSLDQTIRTFTVPHTQVSSHYVIGRDGTVVQMVHDYWRSWHAGAGKWGSVTDLNSTSLGIELDNNGREPFPKEQIESLITLLDTLKDKYLIPTGNFLAHSDIAPTRKQDPSVHFPWETLAKRGFGYWPDKPLVNPPDYFNPNDALRLIGYDTNNLKAAIVAFKRRYIQDDLSPQWTVSDLQVLYDLYLKYY